MSRIAAIHRETKETHIDLRLDLDGTGVADVATGVGFFDHMLTHLARHGLFDFSVGYFKATALSRELDDLINDGHRTTAVPEDVMAVLTPVEK